MAERPLKIVMIGNTNAGKTSIIRSYFNENNKEPVKASTIGMDTKIKMLEYEGKTYKL